MHNDIPAGAQELYREYLEELRIADWGRFATERCLEEIKRAFHDGGGLFGKEQLRRAVSMLREHNHPHRRNGATSAPTEAALQLLSSKPSLLAA